MKLKRFNKNTKSINLHITQNKNNYTKGASIIISIFILFIGIVYFTFAIFKHTSNDFVVIDATVGHFNTYWIVTLNTNGGSVSESEIHVPKQSTIGSIETPIRENYVFEGWFYSDNTPVDVNARLRQDADIYAHWHIMKRTITYNATGGSVSPSSVDVDHGSSISSLPTPTKTDYTFLGWYSLEEGGTKITTSTTFGANTTVYAHWALTETIISYSGAVYTYVVPANGTYRLDVWGAEGYNDQNCTAGKGGHSYGNVTLTQGTTLYAYVGGTNSYNGGGAGCYQECGYAASGGGATHIAKTTGLLPSYQTANNAKNYVYIVAGGGGGCSDNAGDNSGGAGGGTSGGKGAGTNGGAGGTQTTGYAFGQGQEHRPSQGAAGGGGWYGGYSVTADVTGSGGGGGSGYIGGVTNGVTIAGERTGNGLAKITIVSLN